MKKFIYSSVMVLSLFGLSAFAEEYNAYISDAKCGAKHAADMNSKCVQSCVKSGAAPVAVINEKAYKVNDPDKLKDHLGHKVIINGKIDGDTLEITSLKMAE